MKKITKILLGAGSFLIMAGGLLSLSGRIMGADTHMTLNIDGYSIRFSPYGFSGFNSSAFMEDEWENEYGTTVSSHSDGQQSLEAFHTIDVDVSYANINFENSTDYGVQMLWYGESYEIRYSCEGGVLKVWSENENKNRISLDKGNNMGKVGEITVSYPMETTLKEVQVETDFGTVTLDNVQAETLTTDSDCGDVYVAGARVRELSVNNTFGAVTLQDCVADDTLSIDLDCGAFDGTGLTTEQMEFSNNFGDASFTDATAHQVEIEMDSGKLLLTDCAMSGTIKSAFGAIDASSLSSQGLVVNSDSGEVVLEGSLLGVTEINSSFGSVEVTTSERLSDYGYRLDCSFGDISVDGEAVGKEGKANRSGGNNQVNVRSDSGSVSLYFGN